MKFILHLPLKKKPPLKPAASHPIFPTSMIPHVSPFCQSLIPFAVDLWYNGHVVNSQNSLFHTEGGEFPLSELEILVSFIVSVAAGIATHYICKWLDRHKWRQQPKNESPRSCNSGGFPYARWAISIVVSFTFSIPHRLWIFQVSVPIFIIRTSEISIQKVLYFLLP